MAESRPVPGPPDPEARQAALAPGSGLGALAARSELSTVPTAAPALPATPSPARRPRARWLTLVAVGAAAVGAVVVVPPLLLSSHKVASGVSSPETVLSAAGIADLPEPSATPPEPDPASPSVVVTTARAPLVTRGTSAAARTTGARPTTGRVQPPVADAGRLNPSGRDLALSRPAASSSSEAGFTGTGNAFDGDGTTRWGSEFADPQWISVDLGDVWSVTTVQLNWERAYATTYHVDVSRDGSTWTTAWSTGEGHEGRTTITLNHVAARYVRMYGTRRATRYGYSLFDFSVS